MKKVIFLANAELAKVFIPSMMNFTWGDDETRDICVDGIDQENFALWEDPYDPTNVVLIGGGLDGRIDGYVKDRKWSVKDGEIHLEMMFHFNNGDDVRLTTSLARILKAD